MWLAYNIEGKGNELATQMQGACSLAVAAESSIVTNVIAVVLRGELNIRKAVVTVFVAFGN